jgi:hypothetical protein
MVAAIQSQSQAICGAVKIDTFFRYVSNIYFKTGIKSRLDLLKM